MRGKGRVGVDVASRVYFSPVCVGQLRTALFQVVSADGRTFPVSCQIRTLALDLAWGAHGPWLE